MFSSTGNDHMEFFLCGDWILLQTFLYVPINGHQYYGQVQLDKLLPNLNSCNGIKYNSEFDFEIFLN